ncbi:zinc dependent phospholipase C family protein [Acidobacteriota bacterium]
MPKEYAHWILAEKVYLALENPDLKSLIEDNKSLYELGAVIPDTPFYSFLGRRAREFLSAGWGLHGQDGENTFAFISYLNRFYDLENEDVRNNPIWTFILGVITHIVADSQFHPFVYYFSGSPFFPDPKVSKKAHCRHRMIETYLDLYYMQLSNLRHRGKLAAVLKNIGLEKAELFTLLSCLLFSRDDYSHKALQRSIWRHTTIQSKFFSNHYMTILRTVNKLPFIDLDDVIALFYPKQREMKIPLFQKPFRYCHPVTGEMSEQSIPDLENRVIKMCHEIFSDLESWRRGRSPNFRLEDLQGPSAYTGLSASKSETMAYFKIQDVKRLLFSS